MISHARYPPCSNNKNTGSYMVSIKSLSGPLFVAIAGVLLFGSQPAASENVFDKLKKQAQGTLDKTKKQTEQTLDESKQDAQKTVEESTGMDGKTNAAGLKADADNMWKQCYEQLLTSEEYRSCATVCNAARQTITDFEGAGKS